MYVHVITWNPDERKRRKRRSAQFRSPKHKIISASFHSDVPDHSVLPGCNFGKVVTGSRRFEGSQTHSVAIHQCCNLRSIESASRHVTYVPRDTGHGPGCTDCGYSRHMANTSLRIHFSFPKSFNSGQTANDPINVHFNIILVSISLLLWSRLFSTHFYDKHLNSSQSQPYMQHNQPIHNSSFYSH